MKDFKIDHFAPTIIWWLNYISAVGRDYIIGESSIKIPASEYLEKSNTQDIELEFDHPFFLLKRFDMYFKDLENQNKVVFEFKYVKEDSTRSKVEKQRIFDDLMRLFYFIGRKKKGYFLICGNQIHFKTSFESLPIRKKVSKKIQATKKKGANVNKSFYSEWFSFEINNPKKTIDLNTKNNVYKSYYNSFKKNYNDAYVAKANKGKLIMPNSIKTKLLFFSEELIDKNIPQTFKIGVWEINT